MIRQIKYNTLIIVLRWITLIWFPMVPNGLDHVNLFVNTVSKLERDNGSIFAINHLKMIRRLVCSYLSGNPERKTSELIIGINKSNGLPKSITHLHKLIESRDIKSLRFVFTLFSVSRLLPGSKPVDLTTITEPSKSRYQCELEIERYMETFLKENKWNPRFLNPFTKDQLLYSAKSGPNGQATLTALRDIHSMPENLVKALLDTNMSTLFKEYKDLLSSQRIEKLFIVQKFWRFLNMPFNVTKKYVKEVHLKDSPLKTDSKLIKEIISLYNRKTFTQRYEFFMEMIKSKKPDWSWTKPRKLSVIPDPEGKSRIIAIFDYWSQNFLKQIHDEHFRFLRTLSNDRTFTQDPILPKPPEGHKYYSFDLTAATDRFPISLQSKLISKMYGTALAKSWEEILIGTPFLVPWTGEYCKYASGQPMGAYSSWSTFTITHHVILHYIHDYLNISEKYYVILGDDIVIWHDDVAREYLRIMKELGVGISIPKSHICANMYEFAKRLFLDGKEITGIQVRGLYPNLNKYHLIYQMIYVLVYERGYLPAEVGVTIPPLVGHLYTLLGKKDKEVKNLEARTRVLHAFTKFINFGETDSWNQELARRYPNSNFQALPALEINNFIYLAANDAINKTTSKYLGFAERLMKSPDVIEMYAQGLASEHDLYTSPIWYMTQMPIISALANLASSLNSARKLDTIKDLINTIALPSDDVFSESRQAVLAGAAAKLAKITLATFEKHVIQGTLANMPNPNLTSTVLSLMTTELRSYKVSKHVGLIPGENQLDRPPVIKTPDPYGSGVAMW
jgi:hypothetical protein